MKVLVTEHGPRPSVMTKARVLAPQAAKHLADLFAEEEFADSVVIVVDWVGDLFWQGEGPMPEELKTPVMAVITEKRYPMFNNALLTVDYKLELEDFFGRDNATKDDLHEVVENMRSTAREQVERRTNGA
jgi:hypothetical protein